MKLRALKDTAYNLNGGWKGRRKATKGEVVHLPEEVANRLLRSNDWEAFDGEAPSKEKVSQPSENKVVSPKENKVSYSLEHKGFGWYNINDDRGNVVERNIRGEEKAQAKLDKLNG